MALSPEQNWLEHRLDTLENLRRSANQNPEDSEALYSLGEEYFWLGRYREAHEAYREVIRLRPGFAYAHFNSGFTSLILGDKVSARAEYRILKNLNSVLAAKLFKEIKEISRSLRVGEKAGQ
ncbi:MAG: tetratricopeptide repeat protein [bacterium]